MSSFSNSTNIIRDQGQKLDYIVTKNADDIFSRILFNYKTGLHAFNIIGSYGTGKSTFLWALEKHLLGEINFFSDKLNGQFSGYKKFEFFKLVGQPKSIRASFSELFDSTEISGENVLKALDNKRAQLSAKKKVLVLVIDEFGKYLEYARKNDLDDIYFIQQLAEYCNDPEKQVMLITTLHQNFGGYAKGLDQTQKHEWEKVKGRLTDLSFDEPVEQLLFFAAEKLGRYSVPKAELKSWKNLTESIENSNLVGKVEHSNFHDKLFPLDLLSAHILTHALQKYGQNERSLFTFLESKELNKNVSNNLRFKVADVFDYLRKNLSAALQDGEMNPHKVQWNAASKALEKAQAFVPLDQINLAEDILKTIALVNIFTKDGGLLDQEFIENYCSADKKLVSALLGILDQNRVIKFFRYKNKYNFIDGTDVDIQQELINASKHIDQNIDVTAKLSAYFNLSIVSVKKVFYDYGTPRYFEYRFIDSVDDIIEPSGNIDGYINVIVTNKNKVGAAIKTATHDTKAAQVYVLYKEYELLKEHLLEIDKINFLLEKHIEDKVVTNILNEEKHFISRNLEEDFLNAKFNSGKVKWYWNGQELDSIGSAKLLNRELSKICELAYPNMPVFKNELANKQHLSTPILTARKALIRRLLEFGHKENLGFEAEKFPPEKTIYLTLLKETGIHRKNKDGKWSFQSPTEKSYSTLWKLSEDFLNSSKAGFRNVNDLYDILTDSKGLKLKKGLVDFWVPLFLIVNKEKYALYYQNRDNYIPFLDNDVLDLLHKKPSNYLVKAFNMEGVSSTLLNEYKSLTGKDSLPGLESSFISIYSNFIRFYRGLNEYTKQTKNVSQGARNLRDAISKSKDPAEALFTKMPEALGFSQLTEKETSEYGIRLNNTIDELRNAYEQLLDKIESCIFKFLGEEKLSFPDYQAKLQKKLSKLKAGLLSKELKQLAKRIQSPLDDRASYIKSLADLILGRNIDTIKDQELSYLLENFEDALYRLQSVISIHKTADKPAGMFQVQIVDSSGKSQVEISSSKMNRKLASQIEKLVGNKKEDIDTLIYVLKNKMEKNG
ncbi:MAG: hypothetical protein ACI8XB_001953 [Patiriisocius sp.]|jgi:hypothetical protein